MSQADVYQMMAYGRLYACPKLMLLYLHHGGIAAADKTGRYRVMGCGDELITATLDVATRDVEKRLATLYAVGLDECQAS